ncbi:uncharacterized protein BO87DRAFT_394237 [Aspergillus neoniger CBS 115656]|uniref:Major facilitator superfamily (MFS) profile domain-containing protein n=1 Tax=Aspergillus neoniger (strain CBS 115656) TaxID=1448310 RepID=A0A318YS80_ASPNB|nr:hypothetical protein BO87DRAFT_394237 [Aspergillus neoniger CBS 115656]PYH37236.1 hypothetical protein BO87DRAFT_394237 [Aspergillus neoniger CBS 115656]
MFQGLFGSIFGIAMVMGPLIGGGLTDSGSWRWCFYINLPIKAPPKAQSKHVSFLTQLKRLDPLSIFFFVPSIASLLLALQWDGSTYSWSNGRVIAFFIDFGILMLTFAIVQIYMPETATIPARIITQRSIFFRILYTFFTSGGMVLMIYYLPIWCM